MALSSYSTGTVSVSDGDTVIVGSETLWSGAKVKQGDRIYVENAPFPVEVKDVVDPTHLSLWTPWAGGDRSGVDYIIVQDYPARVVGVAAAEAVGTLTAAYDTDGFFIFVKSTESSPNPSFGKDGQYAEQPASGKKWIKQGGVWNYLGVSDPVFSRYDFIVDIAARPASGMNVGRWIAPSLIHFPATLAESVGLANTTATSDAVFHLLRNGVEFATATFAAGQSTVTYANPSNVDFERNDVFEVMAPAVRDNTLADIAMTIVAFR